MMIPSADELVDERLAYPIRSPVIKGAYDRKASAAGSTSRKYVAWSILGLAFFLASFHRDAPGVLVDQWMGEFYVGGAAIGALGSIFCYVYTAMQIPAGLLADTVGPTRTVALGALAAAIGALLFSSAHTITAAYIARLLVGLGASVAFICALKAQALWFEPTAFVAMSGLLSIIGTLGSITAATPLATAASMFGWRPVFVMSAVVNFVIALSLWACMPTESSRHGTTSQALKKALFQVIRNRQTWLCSLMQFGWCGTYIAFAGLWGIPYLMQVYGFNRISASNTMVGASIAFTMGAFTIGFVCGRFWSRRKPLLLIAGVVLVVMWLLLVIVPPTLLSSRFVIAVIICVSLASSVSVLTFAIAKESNPPSAVGFAMAFTNSGFLCGGLLQAAMGYILDRGWQGRAAASGAHIYPVFAYQQGFLVFVLVGLASLAAALLIREGDQSELCR
jgi:predicted MFS family arabinose efflux permease